MSFENVHVSTISLLAVIVFVVLENNIVEETFRIVGHLVANDIKADISFA